MIAFALKDAEWLAARSWSCVQEGNPREEEGIEDAKSSHIWEFILDNRVPAKSEERLGNGRICGLSFLVSLAVRRVRARGLHQPTCRPRALTRRSGSSAHTGDNLEMRPCGME